jgi:hypothetical protein
MVFLRLLVKVELRACIAVFAVSLVVGLIVYASAAASGPSMLANADWAKLGFAYALVLGGGVAVLLGAPVYAFLRYKDIASWMLVSGVGILPGATILALGIDNEIAFWFMGCGLAVAALTHFMCRGIQR